MKFGYYILNTYVPELDGESPELYSHWLEQIDAAEALGFDSMWTTEHHFRYFGGMLPNPQLLLTAAAQRTQRMRLGSAVTLLPMHHPVRIAEDFAMLDLLSNGRLNFGAGRGMHPLEYLTFNADWNTAQLRLPEALDIVVRVLDKRRVRMERRALPLPEDQRLSQTAAEATPADLCHGQPRSRKFPNDRPARL